MLPDLEDYSLKEPPNLPPHLRHIILNKVCVCVCFACVYVCVRRRDVDPRAGAAHIDRVFMHACVHVYVCACVLYAYVGSLHVCARLHVFVRACVFVRDCR